MAFQSSARYAQNMEFVEKFYLKHIEEKCASTKKCYKEVWNNHLRDGVGHIRMREFRTVGASRMLKAIANENDLTRTTCNMSRACGAAFVSREDEGAFDGAIRVGMSIFRVTLVNDARHTPYNLNRFCQFGFSASVTQSSCRDGGGCRSSRGELRGLEWTG